MRLDTSMSQRMEQKMILAPRMIQSMEILQLPVMALQERIEHEMQENPVLETKEDNADEQASPDPSVAGCSVAPSSRHPAIFLIGYRGTGKSTVARLLADRDRCKTCSTAFAALRKPIALC